MTAIPFEHEDLACCRLCEHGCRVNRLQGETGVCRMTGPVIASAALHPAPPESYTVFLAGCNFKCLNCQNWTISQYPDNRYSQRGYVPPDELAIESVCQLCLYPARHMGADRIFFSGGEPTIHLPYIEAVVREARAIDPEIRVNFDTNGYMTESSLRRVVDIATSITFDLKAFHDDVHRALTGAPSAPVLRNAEYIGRYARDRLWEYRIVVIPGITGDEAGPLSKFIARIDPTLPVSFLAFRPNFVLENHPGAERRLMEACVRTAREAGLQNVSWSGHPGIAGQVSVPDPAVSDRYERIGARMAASAVFHAGCKTHPRDCAACSENQACHVKTYLPVRAT